VSGEKFWSEAFEENPMVSPEWVAAVQCGACQSAVCARCLDADWWTDAERPCDHCKETHAPWIGIVKQNALTADVVGYLSGSNRNDEPHMMDKICGKPGKSGYPWSRRKRRGIFGRK
jgi:hypothetical protein